MTNERIYDYTTLSTFLECRKKYYYRMVKHLTPKTTSSALTFGKDIHSALDIYYTSGLDKSVQLFRETYKDREGEELRTVANGVKLLEWYSKVYKHEPFKVLGKPEVGFVFPIGDILYGGRIDLPVDWSGEFWILEHKTTSSMGYNYFKQFELDFQITGYIVCAEASLGRKCMGCLVNAMEPWKEVIKKTARTKEPEAHFARNPMTRSDRDKDRFKLNVQRIVRDIHWCEENHEFYECDRRNQCFTYNSECPYKELCLYGEDPRFIEKDYKVEVWEPYKQVEKEGEGGQHSKV